MLQEHILLPSKEVSIVEYKEVMSYIWMNMAFLTIVKKVRV